VIWTNNGTISAMILALLMSFKLSEKLGQKLIRPPLPKFCNNLDPPLDSLQLSDSALDDTSA